MDQIIRDQNVDKYLVDGCMRCKYGGTPKCKVLKWIEELEMLRQIVLESGLKEEIKWGVPVYTYEGKNVVTVNALKESANIGFFKGVLLSDKHGILQQQGNIQSDRIIRFTNLSDIVSLRSILSSYILEAVLLEKEGTKVANKKNYEPIPKELQDAFEEDPLFKRAFYGLTSGRQRGYLLYFSQAKQSETRAGRIAKFKEQIFNGIGLNDKYSK